MNILIYETNLNGHRLEYIHHIYMLAGKMPDDRFYFVLPSKFTIIKDLFEWPILNNVFVLTFEYNEEQPGKRPSLLHLYKEQRKQAKQLNSYIKEYRIDRIFAIVLFNYFPFMPFLLSRIIEIDGILYSLFPWSGKGIFKSKLDYIKYAFFVFVPHFKNIYTLNDNKSAVKLNSIFFSRKFKRIPDPFCPLLDKPSFNFREYYGISKDKVIFAHFGGLQRRKGTLEIMQSIMMLSDAEIDKYVFVFAGRVYDEIKRDFYDYYNIQKKHAQIIIKDEFCSYEYIASLCSCCDAILMPYHQTSQSSGLIGYASQYSKPVIAPSSGLLGELVKKYKLGYVINQITTEELIKAYLAIAENLISLPTFDYCKENSVDNFQEVIKYGFKN